MSKNNKSFYVIATSDEVFLTTSTKSFLCCIIRNEVTLKNCVHFSVIGNFKNQHEAELRLEDIITKRASGFYDKFNERRRFQKLEI